MYGFAAERSLNSCTLRPSSASLCSAASPKGSFGSYGTFYHSTHLVCCPTWVGRLIVSPTVPEFYFVPFNKLHSVSQDFAAPHQSARSGCQLPPGGSREWVRQNVIVSTAKASPGGSGNLLDWCYSPCVIEKTVRFISWRSRTPSAKPFLTRASGRYSSYLSKRGSSLG